MKVLLINGPVVDDSDSWFYDWFGDPYVSPQKVRGFLAEADGEDIQVSINSGGGSVFAGSEIYTMLKSYSGRVDVVVAGLAASIASVIMLAGDSVKASPMAQIMIHNAQMGQFGDYRDLEHASVVIGGVSQSLISLYTAKTGLDESQIKSFVDDESWFGADRAKELGFVDEVLFTESVSVIASLGNYVSKDKIAQVKAMMNQKQEGNPMEAFLERLASLENRLTVLEDKPVSEIKLKTKIELDSEEAVAMLKNSLIENGLLEEDKKAESPFGKFV